MKSYGVKLLNIIFGLLMVTSLLTNCIIFGSSKKNYLIDIKTKRESDGIRVALSDFELFFNSSNGGEITEYFDLTKDPGRLRNLVNIEWRPWFSLLPFFRLSLKRKC